MKITGIIVALILTALSAQSALLIDTDFTTAEISGSLTQGLQNKLWGTTSANSNADAGWFRGASTWNVDTNSLLNGYSSNYKDGGVAGFSSGFGQINTGNAGVTGTIRFDVVVDSVDLDGGETIFAEIEVFAWIGGTSAFNTSITVENDIVGSNWQLLGKATTADITAAGTYSSGTINMGAGYDQVAVRIQMADLATAAWRDDIFISSITVAPVTVTAIPDTPSNLVATASSYEQISLSWADTSANENGFYIERGADTNSFVRIATNAANSTAFADSGLTVSTEYWYQVIAFNSIGTSSNNPVASATTLVVPPVQTGLLIDTDFASTTGTEFTQGVNNKMYSTTSVDTRADLGWTRGSAYTPTAFTVDDAANTIALRGGTAFSAGGTNAFNAGFGQINTGNVGFTGNISFDVVVDSTQFLDGDETLFLEFDVYGWIGGASTFNTSITLTSDVVGSNWLLLGSATTANINAAGTYTTGLIDMGAGYDQVAVRIEGTDHDSGTTAFNEGFTVSSISMSGGASENPYDDWATSYGLVEGATGDDDGDHVSNFYEYALNGNPTNSADTGMVNYGDDGSGFFTYIHAKRTDDGSLVYTLVDTPDLALPSYSTNAWDSTTSGASGSPNFDSVTNKYDMTGKPQQFIQLIIE